MIKYQAYDHVFVENSKQFSETGKYLLKLDSSNEALKWHYIHAQAAIDSWLYIKYESRPCTRSQQDLWLGIISRLQGFRQWQSVFYSMQ